MTFDLQDLFSFVLPGAIVATGLLLGLVLRRLLVRRLSRPAAITGSRFDDVVLNAVRGPVLLWCFIAGLYVAVQFIELTPRSARVVGTTLVVLIIASITWALARMAVALLQTFGSRMEGGLPGITLIANITRVVVLILGLLVVLQTLGISIAPLITALGIGGLAVALALQDTLANLFAGIHILAARQVRPGDYVRLESGEEGYVVDVSWRQTTIRQLPNNIVIIPNSKLASTVLVNTYLPDREMSVLIGVGVHYASDLEHVERVSIEVAKETEREVSGGVPEFEPLVRYHTFSDSSINFNVILRAQEYVDQHILRHEFIKRLHRRYAEEGITIPFPIRTLEFAERAPAFEPPGSETRAEEP